MIALLLAIVITWTDVQEIPAFEAAEMVDIGVIRPDEGIDLEGNRTRELVAADISWDFDLGTVAGIGLVGVEHSAEGRSTYGFPGVSDMPPGEGRFVWNQQVESADFYRWALLHFALKLDIFPPLLSSEPDLEWGPLVVFGGTITTTYQYEEPDPTPTPVGLPTTRQVPEPGLALVALGGLMLWRRR